MQNQLQNHRAMLSSEISKNFKISNFLNDLYGVPWGEIRNKSDVDGMWGIWKTLFVDVLNKHAPIQSKRIRKRGNIPWLNSEVKARLFKRTI